MTHEFKDTFASNLLRKAHGLSLALGVFVLILSLSAGTAWSFEEIQPPPQSSNEHQESSSSPASADDPCHFHLKAAHSDQSYESVESTRRTAGKAAALGLVFGVRFALGPKEINKNNNARPFIGTYDSARYSRALAIADYRRCKNELALKVLSGWRWKR